MAKGLASLFRIARYLLAGLLVGLLVDNVASMGRKTTDIACANTIGFTTMCARLIAQVKQ